VDNIKIDFRETYCEVGDHVLCARPEYSSLRVGIFLYEGTELQS